MLTWNWNKTVGRVYTRTPHQVAEGKEGYWANLYVGNAWLIEIWENGDQYQLCNFFADKEHLKNCIKDECFKGYVVEYYFYTDMIPELRKGFLELFITNARKLYGSCEIHIVPRITPEEEEVTHNGSND